MTVSDHTPLTVYLLVVLAVAAVSTAAAIGVTAAAVRIWTTNRPRRTPSDLRRGRVGDGASRDSGAALVPGTSAASSPDRQ